MVGNGFRHKAAKALTKCLSLLQVPSNEEDDGMVAINMIQATINALKAVNGAWVGEDCIKPLCGVLPRPVKLDKDVKFEDFMVHY